VIELNPDTTPIYKTPYRMATDTTPIKILETSERVMRNKRIKICKVHWSHNTEEEATWEREEELKAEF
jgi:hypothetical protein